MKLLVATRSEHKLEEIRRILSGIPGLEVLGLDEAGILPSPEEDGLEPHETFEENARSKARYYRERSGLPTVADDSGIEVTALGGVPGVRSKRFAPEGYGGESDRDLANNRYLLDRLRETGDTERSARYVCVAWFIDERGAERGFRGTVEGRIVDGPRGEAGFGYDPLFLVAALARTFGEADPAAKEELSHRGRAFRALAEEIRSRLDTAGPEGAVASEARHRTPNE